MEAAASKYDKSRSQQAAEASTEDKAKRDRIFRDKRKGLSTACKALKPKAAKPLNAVARTKPGPQGQEIGMVTTVPHEVDEEVRAAWGKVHEGNVTDQLSKAYAFVTKYFN